MRYVAKRTKQNKLPGGGGRETDHVTMYKSVSALEDPRGRSHPN